jgi:hypothetical protein
LSNIERMGGGRAQE